MRNPLLDVVPAGIRDLLGQVPDPRNRLNDLSGTQWLVETKSVWRQRGLGQAHPHAEIERLHPAPFSFQDVGRLIAFFTKSGEQVLDPFVGVGSTLKACALLGRRGIGIELSAKWSTLARSRLKREIGLGHGQRVLRGDASVVLKRIPNETIDFVLTSPPYWNILAKTADYKGQARLQAGLDAIYSDDPRDLGNVKSYDKFLAALASMLATATTKLRPGKYAAFIVSDFRHGKRFIPFHADLIAALNGFDLELRGITILEQTHKALKPYGYPYAFVSNVHHQYILVFQRSVRP